MEKFKKILLNISANKGVFFLKSFLIAIVFSIACFTFVFMLVDKGVHPVTVGNFESYKYAPYINMGLSIIWLVFFVFMVAVYLIIAIKITSFQTGSNRIILFKNSEGEIEIYKQPMWGKYPRAIINFPDNWARVIREGGVKHFRFPFEIPINRQMINGHGTEIIIVFPITLTLKFSGPLWINDLKKICCDETGRNFEEKNIDIDDYIYNHFIKINSKKEVLNKIKEAAIGWNDGKISQVYLRRFALKNLQFPEKFFSNIVSLEINADLAESRIVAVYDQSIADRNGF